MTIYILVREVDVKDLVVFSSLADALLAADKITQHFKDKGYEIDCRKVRNGLVQILITDSNYELLETLYIIEREVDSDVKVL